ncbi:phosphate/phosphite/phosphonate ABC transporter substrate-binding protein [Natronorubrum texcoconense]|uniref:phosphate/phosphite/phosphonate ABC transporter substrate-binding protein n=1 Tax=Natronorubrum texcoconense TaxID=1095776 RepID=UPI0015871EDC|nr:phosphate/phosphite/phosphonate ABC transporter substrate-binding protein [Natronorubrum texcoconense]
MADEFVFAATVRDDPDDVERDYTPLAEWVESKTGVPTRIDPVQGDSAAISALATGQAHAAYLSGGPSWVGWQEYGLEPLAVEADEAGQTYYTAAAWVHSDSGLETVEDLEGVDSCHTGDLTGAGMLIPVAYLAQEGLVSFEEDDDVTAIRDAVEEFFGDPVVGGGYVGALQCLSEGHGDVAFVRKSTPEDYCGGEDAEDWCLNTNEYDVLEEFADVPSHPIMASPEATDVERELLQNALLELNDGAEGQEILADVLGVYQLQPSTSEEHLGAYGELIEILPGIADHLVE